MESAVVLKTRDIYSQEAANVPGLALAQAKIFALAATELQHQVVPSPRWMEAFKDTSIPFPPYPTKPLGSLWASSRRDAGHYCCKLLPHTVEDGAVRKQKGKGKETQGKRNETCLKTTRVRCRQ